LLQKIETLNTPSAVGPPFGLSISSVSDNVLNRVKGKRYDSCHRWVDQPQQCRNHEFHFDCTRDGAYLLVVGPNRGRPHTGVYIVSNIQEVIDRVDGLFGVGTVVGVVSDNAKIWSTRGHISEMFALTCCSKAVQLTK
jgi:hypothetical protein